MMIKLKICGLTRSEDIAAVNAVLPDYVGFIFANSRRQINEEKAAFWAGQLDARIKKVGVFVNDSMAKIVKLAANGVIDLVQLHGDEGEDYLRVLKKQISNPIIKAVRVQTEEQILEAAKLPCDYLLLDTYTKGQYGGSGIAFDWQLIPKIEKPFFLAGGLSADNLLQAVSECQPYCLDISSGVETDGIKDKAKIIKVAEILRSVG